MTETAPSQVSMEKITSLCRRRGFIFQSSEIYGGLGSCWDYGPLGVEMKRNIKEAWWRANVRRRDDMVGIDTSILMHPRTWEASGHLENFADPLVDCMSCRQRFRADELKEAVCPACGGKAVRLGISVVNARTGGSGSPGGATSCGGGSRRSPFG